ncbi:hypothetical protein ACGFK1_19175 [Mycobacterium sp. NPDC048908]|uniref:hypothetical protein n=1 Tax=Mycobacterium sp. NPDC048908 TaxID=3364292 RepID=UPI0037226A4E
MPWDRFRSLLTSPGPYGSVYFDWNSRGVHCANSSSSRAPTRLCRQASKRPSPEAVPPWGAVAARADGVLINEHRTGPTVQVSSLPYTVPLVEHGDEHVTVAPNENVLSELGTAPTQTLPADEALPMLAVSTGAALVRTDKHRPSVSGRCCGTRCAET